MAPRRRPDRRVRCLREYVRPRPMATRPGGRDSVVGLSHRHAFRTAAVRRRGGCRGRHRERRGDASRRTRCRRIHSRSSVWRCEEPVRFSQGKAGSLLFTGKVTPRSCVPSKILPSIWPRRWPASRPTAAGERACDRELSGAPHRTGPAAGARGTDRRRGDGRRGADPAARRPHGRADHSGATPMEDRRDALCAAAELVLAVEAAARREAPPGTVATARTSPACRAPSTSFRGRQPFL